MVCEVVCALLRTKGTSATEAYALAGYKKDDGHASRLAGNGRVLERVRELKEAIAEKAIVTEAKVLKELKKIAFAYVPDDEVKCHDKLSARAKYLGMFGTRPSIPVRSTL